MCRMRHIALMVVCLVAYEVACAQVRTLPTREEIDEVIHPSLSTIAERGIRADSNTIDVGEVDSSESITISFTLRNNTNQSIAITALNSTCSCLDISTPCRVLHGGESMTLEAIYNPAGRIGEFEQMVYVYTSLDEHSPTEQLTISGKVTTTDSFPHLRYRMGALRLSRTTVTLDGVKVGATRSERIVVANSGDSDITLGATTTIEGLQFKATPATLRPGKEGEITISYTPEELPLHDIETALVVEGCEARPTERMIKITIKR